VEGEVASLQAALKAAESAWTSAEAMISNLRAQLSDAEVAVSRSDAARDQAIEELRVQVGRQGDGFERMPAAACLDNAL
jgi:multidrug resistance efflux pump